MNPEVIENMIEKGCDSYEARLAAGQARLKADNLEKALEHLQKATAHKPGQTMAWQELGTVLNRLERPDEARQAWQQGVETARANGDKQAEKVMGVFLRRLDRQDRT
ncbi:MAG TPA: hypothetical protein VK064_00475 [Wenzhouxiangella sp.]|nr:hypothetical protein [Wenzhouxiangella sp.]